MAEWCQLLLSILAGAGFINIVSRFGIELYSVTIALTIITTYVLNTNKGLLDWLYVASRTLLRDFRGIKIIIKWRFDIYRFHKRNGNIIREFESQVKKHPNKTCFISDSQKWTFKEVDEFTDRVASVFHKAGYVKGEVVALFMESTPEMICMWLGLAKLGVITALTNHQLRSSSLVHMITIVNPKALIFGTNLGNAVADVKSLLASGIQFFHYGEDGDGQFTFAKSLMKAMPSGRPNITPKVDIKPHTPLLYMYTSGTTGFPKAAVFTHLRYYFMLTGFKHFLELRRDDVIYSPLPLYHPSAGVIGVGQALCSGLTVVTKKKFSASQFWDDCIKNNCTVGQYIGEICRYLLAQPPKPQDRAHSIRLMFGGGLRPNLWDSFVNRFGIAKIGEFYGSTEGAVGIVNIDNTSGAVGFFPNILSFAHPAKLIRVDDNTLTPLRTQDGLCIKCKPGEPGVFAVKITKERAVQVFDGYADKGATSKLIISDVFRRGDQVYISGDILVMDRWGYVYFVDRGGDTFRWKGENVSTSQVEALLSTHTGLTDSVVYGVQVPNCEGKAGMAAILDVNGSVDVKQVFSALSKELPPYARPLFIRITDSIPLTGTFKLKKVELQRDGFNPAMCANNKLYYLIDSKYCVLTKEVYDDICSGQIRY